MEWRLYKNGKGFFNSIIYFFLRRVKSSNIPGPHKWPFHRFSRSRILTTKWDENPGFWTVGRWGGKGYGNESRKWPGTDLSWINLLCVHPAAKSLHSWGQESFGIWSRWLAEWTETLFLLNPSTAAFYPDDYTWIRRAVGELSLKEMDFVHTIQKNSFKNGWPTERLSF